MTVIIIKCINKLISYDNLIFYNNYVKKWIIIVKVYLVDYRKVVSQFIAKKYELKFFMFLYYF